MSEGLVFPSDQFGPTLPAAPVWNTPAWRVVAQEVADKYGLTWEEITGVGRCRRVVHPRQEAMARIYAAGKLSLPAIGQRFNRDHTTVLWAIRAFAKRQAAA